MSESKRAFERAMRLAVVSGLRSTFGMALMESAYGRPNKQGLGPGGDGRDRGRQRSRSHAEPGLAADR